MVVQLIAKDKQEKLRYEGNCKLMIDSVSKLLLVEPVNEEYKMISAMFKWKFVAQKNIIFVFAEYDFQDFALIFDDPNKCRKIYKILSKKEATPGNKELIHERVLPELFNEISANNESSSKLKEILLKWIEFHDGNEKKRIVNPRKRKAKDYFYQKKNIEKNYEFDAKRPNGNLKKIIESPNFEVLKYVQNGQSRTKLSIFLTSGRKYCYEYFWRKCDNFFVCHSCKFRKKYVSAKIVKRNGNDVVMLSETQHVCEMKDYKQIIEKPNFETFSYERNKICNKRFIMFLDPSQIYCYEYTWNSQRKTYYCCGCASKKLINGANICQKEDGTEFVMLKSNEHVCEPRKHKPEKYGEKEIVEAEDFKVFEGIQDGKDKSKLVIFASSDKSTCYEYYWLKKDKKFSCLGCIYKKNRTRVTAELCVHDDGSNYVKLSKKKHVCEPREFKSEKYLSKKDIVESSNFRIFKYLHNGVQTSKLIVFSPTNKNFCYEYYWNQRGHLYQCPNCPAGKRPTATVCQNEDSKDYLILDNGEHSCILREFNPEKYRDDLIVDKTMYKFISTNFGNTAKFLAIFTTQEKQFYYKFVFSNQRKYYCCSRCRLSNTYITAKLQNEGKENEILYVCNQKHICEPFKYSIVVENNIVKFPNFEMIKRKFHGKIHQHLVVFTNEEKTECYEYSWEGRSKIFRCRPCSKHHKNHIYAKLFKNDENEECVELSKNEHQCQPINYVPENDVHISERIVKEPDFKLYEILFRGKNMKKLAFFDSNDRNYGYVYTYNDKQKKYVCPRCNKKCKFVTATLKQQENGQNYVELNENEHVCELQKL